MPEVAWETIVGALALVALVAGAQYIRTSGSPLSTPSKQGLKETVQDVKQKVTGESGKKKKKKSSASKESGKSAVSSDANAAESRDEVPSTSTPSTSGSYAEIARSAAQEDSVGHDEVIEPAPAGKKANKKKKKAKTAAAATEVPSINVTESKQSQSSAEPSVAPDTSNDASLAAALSAEEQNTTTANETSSESESDDEVAPLTAQKKSAGAWEKPKKVVGGGSDKVSAGWETASTSRASITSTNRFSALSLGSPSSHGANVHKKALPRTSASGVGKHKVDSSADASAPTKLQKKNAAAAAAKKAAKEAEEKDRLERLAKYRKEQVKEKINAIYAKPKQNGVTVAANNRSLSNGMRASVEGGKLVWD